MDFHLPHGGVVRLLIRFRIGQGREQFFRRYHHAIAMERRSIRARRFIQSSVLSPIEDLQNDTTYTAAITIDQDLVVEDMAGNSMQQTSRWTFTTLYTDTEAPHILTRSPEHGAMDTALNTIVQIRFSEPVNPLTISADSVYLQRNDTTIQCALTYDDQLNIVTLTPVGDLQAGSTHTVIVTTDVTDLAGNAIESSQSWSFVTRFSSWYTENTGKVQAIASTAITLDSTGRPHIGMTNIGHTLIDISRISADTWDEDQIFATQSVGFYQDMVIDSQNTRNYIYYRTDAKELTACTESILPGGGIRCAVLNPSDAQVDPLGVSIAVAEESDGSVDRVSVCYYDQNKMQLIFATEPSRWVSEIVDTDGGEYPSLAVAPTGTSHISYYDSANGHLKYATRTPDGSWSTQTIDNNENVGFGTAIALDTEGNPHISYLDDQNESLKYATRQPSGEWLVETVEDGIRVGSSTDIAMDSSGLPHISFYDTENGHLMYATQTAIGQWHVAVVDDYDTNGVGSSIIVDNEDYVHISYGYSVPAIAGYFVRYATTRP
jgi:hypothetical protein